MPKDWADRIIMFSVIGFVAWAIIALPTIRWFGPEPWLTKDAAGFFTFALVIVGFLQILLFLWQLRLIRESLDDTKEAADAAKVAAETGKIQAETAQQQLRAYVFLENSFYERTKIEPAGGLYKITYRIKNFGSTPAHNVQVASAAEVVQWNDGQPVVPVPDSIETLGSMAPNQDFYDLETADELSFNPIGLQEVGLAVYLVGTITYDTVFGGPRRKTNFRCYIGGDQENMEIVRGEMFTDAQGNDAT
jgi:hypothetical protein